jgi:DNA topoisomerase I
VPRLRYVSRFEAGLGRRRRGRGFAYVDETGRPVGDPEHLERIRRLAVPPAWQDVWICAHPRGHLQATGLDVAGRRQYLYHEAWRDERDREKFERTRELGALLPAVRRVVSGHLRRRGLPRERVLAGAVRMLDRGFLRIGGEEYADENGSFGVATLRRRHAQLDGASALVFDYVAKGGARRRQRIVDRPLRALVEELKDRRGPGGLLAYRADGRWADIRSSDVNDYIKEISGGDFTAKDFRTWHATVLAAVAISVHGDDARSRAAQRRAISAAVGDVAGYLGNTPTVCRASYVDPRVFERFEEGATIRATVDDLAELSRAGATAQRRVESAVLRLLSDD